MRAIAISDIHGHAATFRELVEEQVILSKQDKLFLLGDYVHRGPDYKGVFDYILELKGEGYQVEMLLGNHEFIWFDELCSSGSNLLSRPFRMTNEAFQKEYEKFLNKKKLNIAPKYKALLKDCKFYAEYENFIFVHAGLDFTKKDPFADKYELVWTRKMHEHLNEKWLAGRKIIHGHTPKKEAEIRYRIKSNKSTIGIDNGCFMTQLRGMGQLCALDVTNMELYFQENIDKNKWHFW